MIEEQTEMELAGLRRWNKSGVIKMESAVRKWERRREKKESWTCPSLSYGGWRSQRRGAKDRSRGREKEKDTESHNIQQYWCFNQLKNERTASLNHTQALFWNLVSCLSRQHLKSSKTHSVFLPHLPMVDKFRIFSRHVKTIYIL